MRKLIILVDMDDVLSDFLQSWIDYLNTRYGLSVRYQDVTKWDMKKAYPELTDKQIYSPLAHRSFWHKVNAKKDAVKSMVRFIEQGHVIRIVTSSSPITLLPKLEGFLLRKFPFFSYRDVIVSYDKKLIKGDVMIDDGPHNLVGGEYKKILFTAPHNISIDTDKYGFIRADEWKDVVAIIDELATEKLGDR